MYYESRMNTQRIIAEWVECKETFAFTVRIVKKPPMLFMFSIGAALNLLFGGTAVQTLGFLFMLFLLVFWVSYDTLRKRREEQRLTLN